MNVIGAKGVLLLSRFFCFSDGFVEKGVGKVLVYFLPHHFNSSPPLLHAFVVGLGLQLQEQEAEVKPKQEAVTVFSTYVTIPKDPMGRGVP